MEKLTGLIAAPFTPMDEAGNIDLSGIDRLAPFLKRNGIQGVFICGTTGEGPLLSKEEKLQIIDQWARHRSADFRVLVMLGGNSIPVMQALASHTQSRGLDGIAILAPYYYKTRSVEELIEFCAEVTGPFPDLPLFYYHLPAFTGAYYDMIEFLRKSQSRLPNLVGIKFTHNNIMDFHACVRFKDKKYNLLWGTDEALLSGLVIGADGAIGSTYNYAAPLYHQIFEAHRRQDLKLAESLQYKAVQMIQVLLSAGGVGGGKAFMKIIGMDCGVTRRPNLMPDEKTIQKMDQKLKEIGFFTFSSRT